MLENALESKAAASSNGPLDIRSLEILRGRFHDELRSARNELPVRMIRLRLVTIIFLLLIIWEN